ALAESQRHLAESQRHLAELALDKGLTLCEQGEVGRGMLWLAHSLELAPPGAEGLGRVIRTNLAGWRGLSGALRECSPSPGGLATYVNLSPDGKPVLIGNEGTVQFWDRAAARPRGPVHRHPVKQNRLLDLEVSTCAFSPDSRTCLTGSEDNTA